MDWKYPFKRESLDIPLAIAFNTRGNDMYWATTSFLLAQTAIFKNLSVIASISLWGPGAEHLFKEVVKQPVEYVLLIDSDVAPTIDTPIRLIERDRDIIAAPALMYDGANNDIHFNFHLDESMQRIRHPLPHGLHKVFQTSWACVLIKRRVFEMFRQTGESFTKWSELIDERWKELPPDSMFFEKAKAFGFEIWMDWDLDYATHHKYVALNAPTIERYVATRLYDESPDEHARRAISTLSGRCSAVRTG